jgi:hypothetical protein
MIAVGVPQPVIVLHATDVRAQPLPVTAAIHVVVQSLYGVGVGHAASSRLVLVVIGAVVDLDHLGSCGSTKAAILISS